MELTPRPRPAATRRSVWPKAVIALVVVALGAIAVQGLNNAAVYFYNVDEAVAMRDDLADRRFRLQGAVVEGSIERTSSGARFEVAHSGQQVTVVHAGSTPEMFQAGVPVVLEGRWSAGSDHFESDRILVKHSEEYEEADYDEYEAEHPDRLDGTEVAPSAAPGSRSRP
jgi:cytochrome c-type biogenesis protein CcmE